MKRSAATRMLAMMLAAVAACRENTGESSTDAARADSSAAGYVVGQRGEGSSAARDTPTPMVAALPNAGGPPLAGRGTPALPAGARPIALADTTRVPDTARAARKRKPLLPNVSTAPARPDSTPRAAPPPTGPVRVNEFLTYDARSRTVSLQLIAGYNGLNGSLNYNGSTNGSHGLSVPLGWRVHIAVVNRDSDLQHSAIIVNEVLPPPIEPANPAFSGAALPQLDEGLHEDETGTLDFIASQAGRYMIACGVAGHAQAGMWLQFAVVKDAAEPAYR